jgi:hypothetical protein
MPKSLWELEEKVRNRLVEGVDFGNGRRLAATVGLNWFVWIKLDENVKPKRLTVMYIKGAVRVTVEALVSDDDKVEITSVSLSSMCVGRGDHA